VIFERRSKGKRGREKEKERERGERERERKRALVISLKDWRISSVKLKCKRHICIFFSRYNARCEYIF